MWTLSGFADEIDDDFATQCEVLNRLGVTHLELRSAWGVNVLDLDEAQRAECRRLLAEHGLSVSSIGSPIGKISITDDLEPHLQRFAHALDVADEFGAPYIRLFSFFIPEGEDADGYRDEVMRRMTALAAAAQGRGVTLLHENEKDIFGDIPRRCVDIAETVEAAHPGVLRLVFDPANYVQCGVVPVDEGYDAVRPHLAYIHVKDAKAADSSVHPAGEGDGQVRQLVQRLEADGFDGFFSLEPHLGEYTAFGALSGPEQWTRAHAAFTTMLRDEGVEYA